MPERQCTKCGFFKPLEQFTFRKDRGKPPRRHNWCNACKAAQTRDWAKRVGKKRARNGGLMRMYGITHEDYAKMFASQDGRCACCGDSDMPIDPRTGEKYDLAVDHDHTTGAVRALLCPSCNNGLGCFKDDPVRLHAALAYLARFKTI